MRLPKLLMGSLLLVPLACGGDDGGDTGNDTGGTSPTTGVTMSTTMTAGDDDGVDDGVDDGMMTSTTGEPPADSSSGGPPADSSSGEPPADDSGSGSSSGGAASECEMYCATFFELCGADPANDYADEPDCVTRCDGWTPAQFENCRVIHLMNVAVEGVSHCAHANIDGGGVCPEG